MYAMYRHRPTCQQRHNSLPERASYTHSGTSAIIWQQPQDVNVSSY